MTRAHAAATAVGLQPMWHDVGGRLHRVDDAVLEAIAACLDTIVPDLPFLSAEAGTWVAIPTGPAGLVLEDGTAIPPTIADGRLLAPQAIGYHQLTIAGRTTTLAVAPPRCPQPRRTGWGIAVQIPALRDASDTAYGDLGTLARTANALGRSGCSALAISPTHALFPADASRFSPYSPSTRLFHNVLLADPTVIGGAPLPAAAPELIDWHGAIPARLAHLRSLFAEASDQVRADVAGFRARSGAALEAHARFDALDATFGGGWRAWPSAYHDPSGPAVERFVSSGSETVAFYAFLQWLADRSLAAAQYSASEHMATGLIADLAVGVDIGGSHSWSRGGELLDGLTIGAPPDPLGPGGQDWGITTFDPFALARGGFRPFMETIRTALTYAGGIRIDHALGLDRLWVVPRGEAASEGAYLTMPSAHLKRIIAIEAFRANAIVIAEDLGTVPTGFRDDLSRRGMLGMRVLLFERDAAGSFVPPVYWPDSAVAMTGTHDTPTLVGWWGGRDLDWSARLGRTADAGGRVADRASLWHAVGGAGEPPAAAPLDAILVAVADAPTPLAIIPLEDLIGSPEQPNIPGTVDQHPNWRRRMPADTASLLTQPEVVRRAELLTAKRPG